MKVYVVLEITDYEYGCSEVAFITSKEEIAKDYIKRYQYRWGDDEGDALSYEEYKVIS